MALLRPRLSLCPTLSLSELARLGLLLAASIFTASIFAASVFIGGQARAGMVSAPPEGADEVALLLCAGDGCADRIFWISYDEEFADVPVLVVDALLTDNATATRDEGAGASFVDALERARVAVVDERWRLADNALNEAERALTLWRGSPDNQQLFSLWYLRGAAALGAGMQRVSADAMTRAAATTWNRSVTLPTGTEAWADAYYKALADVIAHEPGLLVIEEGATPLSYSLDGVPLGSPPLRVRVFAGEHRLTAQNTRGAHAWDSDVRVVSGRTTTSQARLADTDDAQWAAFELAMAVATLQMDPAMADLLDQWSERNGVRTLRLLRLDAQARVQGPDEIEVAVGDGLPLYEVREVRYDPALRSMQPVER